MIRTEVGNYHNFTFIGVQFFLKVYLFIWETACTQAGGGAEEETES